MALALLVTASAKDLGKETFALMCSSCHGANGEGIAGGAFPPLQGSEWLSGDGQRVAQILLHGLHGPISVKGISYNLAMPPQVALSEEQKVAVINFVRQQFSDEKAVFTLQALALAKKASATRELPWSAEELSKQYPMPRPKPAIANLVMSVYHGKWEGMPDFSKLERVAVEEEHHGFISLKSIKRKDHYGVVWDGDFDVAEAGTYEFELDSDDGSRLQVNGKTVTEVVGKGGRKKKGIAQLSQGVHPIKVEYYQVKGHIGIGLKWRKVGNKAWESLTDSGETAKHAATKMIDLTPEGNQVRMYNNFIAGSTPRCMGVGFPNGNSIAFSTENCNVDLLWSGRFISAARHWTGRGQGNEAPASNNVVSLAKGIAWSQNGAAVAVQLKGFVRDPFGSPAFRYQVRGGEAIVVHESYQSEPGHLVRNLRIESNTAQTFDLKLAEAGSFQDGAFVVSSVQIELPDGLRVKAGAPKPTVILPLKPGVNTFTFDYLWIK